MKRKWKEDKLIKKLEKEKKKQQEEEAKKAKLQREEDDRLKKGMFCTLKFNLKGCENIILDVEKI